jgi:ferritin-like metal-binding protein YciE
MAGTEAAAFQTSVEKIGANVNYKHLMIKDLQDLYQAESDQERLIPQLISALDNNDLRTAFQEHLDQTQQHVLRLREVLDMAGAVAVTTGK